jgi:hypothetical protein
VRIGFTYPVQRGGSCHCRSFLVSASLAGLLLLAGAPTWTSYLSAQTQPEEQSKATKTIAGTVTSIGSDGHSFGLEVDQNGQKQTMQFVVDKNAKVQGQVKVGTPVTVEYAMGRICNGRRPESSSDGYSAGLAPSYGSAKPQECTCVFSVSLTVGSVSKRLPGSPMSLRFASPTCPVVAESFGFKVRTACQRSRV